MKHLSKSICILLTVLLTLLTVPFSSFADTSKTPEAIDKMPAMQNVSRYKVFTVRFDDTVEDKDIRPGQIYVLDSYNKPKQIHIENGSDKMSLIIRPTGSGYIPGKKYTLWIKYIKTRTGRTLKKPVKMDFSIREYPKLNTDFTFNADNGTILSYNGNSRSVVIPEILENTTVRQIGAHAFDRRYLTSVIIPDSVTVIHESAFANNQLPHIELPKNLISIGSNAFTGNRLTNITIPNSVRSIGHSAFSKNLLYKVQLSDRLSAIEHHTFSENRLQLIKIPSLVAKIGDSAFAYNEIESVTFAGHTTNTENSSLHFIGHSAFRNNYIQRLRLPDSVDTVETWAFAHNEIRELTLPGKIRHIYSNAFRYNDLSAFRILIPPSLVDSPERAFDPDVKFIRK